jgi:hypothetical protein
VSLRRKLAIIALVYVIEGFPMGVYQSQRTCPSSAGSASYTLRGPQRSSGRPWSTASASGANGSPGR